MLVSQPGSAAPDGSRASTVSRSRSVWMASPAALMPSCALFTPWLSRSAATTTWLPSAPPTRPHSSVRSRAMFASIEDTPNTQR